MTTQNNDYCFSKRQSQYLFFKRCIDIVLSLCALFVLSPILLLVAFLVRLLLGRPVFFRQMRPGLNGKPFTLIKFRTMRESIDAQGNPLPDQERLSRFGAVLRKTSLDELPELWNVLKGDMSLVGPRPLLMEYLPYYTERESLRHSVRPGITGLAQVSGRNTLSWDDRLELDIQYIESISLRLDMIILFKTVMKVVLHQDVITIPGLTQKKLSDYRRKRANV